MLASMAAARMTRSEFDAATNLPSWRVLGNVLVGDWVADGSGEAVAFAQQVAEIASAAQHHADIDIRHPGRVRITLSTLTAGGLTQLDADVAARITALASASSLRSDTAVISRFEVAIDALDISGLLPFWRAVLGYVDERPANPADPVDALVDPLRIGPALWFQQMDAPRPQRNRVHVDISVPHDVAERRVADAIAAGGRLLDASHARSFWVLADPEGNEVCVCTWQDRD